MPNLLQGWPGGRQCASALKWTGSEPMPRKVFSVQLADRFPRKLDHVDWLPNPPPCLSQAIATFGKRTTVSRRPEADLATSPSIAAWSSRSLTIVTRNTC